MSIEENMTNGDSNYNDIYYPIKIKSLEIGGPKIS